MGYRSYAKVSETTRARPHDSLSARFDTNDIHALTGLLARLNKETNSLAGETQKDGKPRDLAEEQWISELAA